RGDHRAMAAASGAHARTAQRRGARRHPRPRRGRARPPARDRHHRRDPEGRVTHMAIEPGEWGYATDFADVNGQVAICGVGDSDMSKASGRTTTEIVGQAVERALDDAGLSPTDIDGLMYSPMPEQFGVAAFHEYFG